MIDIRELVKRGVHFGHLTSRWDPNMKPYIYGAKNGIHLIDVSKTAQQLEKAALFLESVAAEGKPILWVGTKKSAYDVIARIGRELNVPHIIHRWVGGTFSNYRQVRKSVANLLHFEDILTKSEQFPYRKKELNTFQKRRDRLDKNVGGIRQLAWPVGAVVVVDVKKEHVCIKEAIAMGIPIVALVDTNCSPLGISYVIPANDDVPRSVEILLMYLADAVKRGLAQVAARPQAALPDILDSISDSGVIGVEDDSEEEKARRRKAAHVANARGPQSNARGPQRGGGRQRSSGPKRDVSR